MSEILDWRKIAEVKVGAIDDDCNNWVEVRTSQWLDVAIAPDCLIPKPNTEGQFYDTNETLLRNAVARRLEFIGQAVKKINPNWKLQLLEGYRPLELQKRMFDQQLQRLAADFPDKDELMQAAHQFVAVPEVAGHTTGGSVDVQIIDEIAECPLDFGTKYLDFNDKTATNSTKITPEQTALRAMLSKLMEYYDFYDYPGEWWHFDFGNKEATLAQFGLSRPALYGQKAINSIKFMGNPGTLHIDRAGRS
jgi:D-alanyl-D-alanine dipeptidase